MPLEPTSINKLRNSTVLLSAAILLLVTLFVFFTFHRLELLNSRTNTIQLIDSIEQAFYGKLQEVGGLLLNQNHFFIRHSPCVKKALKVKNELLLAQCHAGELRRLKQFIPIREINVYGSDRRHLMSAPLNIKPKYEFMGDYLQKTEETQEIQIGYELDANGNPQGIVVLAIKYRDKLYGYLAFSIPLQSWLDFLRSNFTADIVLFVPIKAISSEITEADPRRFDDYLMSYGNKTLMYESRAILQLNSQGLKRQIIRRFEIDGISYAAGIFNLEDFSKHLIAKVMVVRDVSESRKQLFSSSILFYLLFIVFVILLLVPVIKYINSLQKKMQNSYEKLSGENQQRKKIEYELLNQRNMLSSIMDAIPVPLFYKDHRMYYQGCNKPFLNYLGLRQEEVEGKSVYDIAPQELADIYQQADLNLFKQGGRQTYEAQVKYADGSLHDIKFFKSVYDDAEGNKAGIIGVMLDITELKASSNLLSRQRRYLQTIINSVAEPIRVINRDYSIGLMNRAAEDAIDSRFVADMMHPKCYELFHRSKPCEGENFPCPIEKILDSKTSTKVVHDHSEDTSFSFIELTATPLFDLDGKVSQIVEISRDITAFLETQQKLQSQKQALNHLANHDSLTSLPNRRLFFERLQHSVNMASQRGEKLAVLFIDLDRFKPINDSLGHEIGDRVLKLVANRLSDSVRGHDTVARLGGDEFIILLESIPKQANISKLAEKLTIKLASPMVIDEHEVHISISIGISMYPKHGDNAHALIKNADIAMYSAKAKGRNTFDYFSYEMMEQASERVSMENSIRKGLANREFEMFYQIQLSCTSNELTGMEALIRWNHPQEGFIVPDRFIPIAEHSGLIIPLGEWIFETVTQQVKQWRDIGLNTGRVAINLSGIQLEQENLFDTVSSILAQNHCEPEWLELEVTEGFVMKDPEQSIGIMKKLQRLGIQIAIDDFGTGYSSLAYLKRLPISRLKIDRSFILDLPDDEDDQAISKSIIALGKSMNMRVLAEGVETKEQLQFLADAGCDDVQGYYFSRPIDVKKMTRELQKYS